MINKLKTTYKYLLSFLKTNWELDDYPIKYEFHPAVKGVHRAFWSAEIIGGLASYSTGETRKDVYKKLATRFAKLRESGRATSRPGTWAPLELASTNEISTYRLLAIDFATHILGFTNGRWWFSDKSTLWPMIEPEQRPAIIEKIKLRYGVDISDLIDGNLVTIFGRISKEQQPKSEA